MLGVTVPAAALLLPAVLGHHKVVAAVVAEDAATEPKKCLVANETTSVLDLESINQI